MKECEMKISTLLTSVAAFAVIGTAAQADSISRGEFYQPGWLFFPGTNEAPSNPLEHASTLARSVNVNASTSAWYALGGSLGNNGTVSLRDGATFTLKGHVNRDCSFYSGSSTTQSLDFGTLGIHATDNSPSAAFDMVAPADVVVTTNLAGCNTANTVKITKNSVLGLINSGNSAGYDDTVFQANLPFRVDAVYKAVDLNDVGPGAIATLSVPADDDEESATHGAWKSAMALNVFIPVPSKSLLAGTYNGSVKVEITAF